MRRSHSEQPRSFTSGTWSKLLFAIALSLSRSYAFVNRHYLHPRYCAPLPPRPFNSARGDLVNHQQHTVAESEGRVLPTSLPSPSPSSYSTSFSAATLEDRTKVLLSRNRKNESTRANNQGQLWTQEMFDEAQVILTGWSLRHSRKAALMVERIIRRVIQQQQALQQQKPPETVHLDMATMYTCAIRGWSNSRERAAAAHRAEEILDTLQYHYSVDGVVEMQPPREAFNLVLLAYARSGLPDAPQQALRVLEKWHGWCTHGETDVIPNKESYAIVLRAFARTGKPDAPARVKRLLEHLERLSQQQPALYSSVRPDYMCHGAYISALIDSMDRDYITGEEAATEATHYLLQLLASDYESAKPDGWIFNMVLAAWRKSSSEEMVARAKEVLQLFEDYHEWSGRTDKTRPNTVSYNFLIACHSRSRNPNGDEARSILRRMQALVASGNNTNARPDVVTYNTVMSTYSKSRALDAPYEVEALLREMHQEYLRTGDPRLRPNRRSYNTCVTAWARSNIQGSAARVMDWIAHMQANAEREGRRSLRPDKWAFNAFLQALSKSGEPSIGEEAEAVLDRMVEYYQDGWIELKPDVLTFTNVIHCIAMSGADDALERALAIVRRMEDLHEQGYGDVRPNAYTYNCVINTAAKSNRPGKAQIAFQILLRMREVALRPPTVTYNNVLNACAYSDDVEGHNDDILEIAKQVFEEANESCGANCLTYAAYMRVIRRFIKDRVRKENQLMSIFHECCEAGQLTKLVMKQMKEGLTARQYAAVRKKAIDEEISQYRPEFTKNVQVATRAGSPAPSMVVRK